MILEEEDFKRTVYFEHYRTSIELVRELGVLAIKTLITLNSGAFIVLLTFIGNVAAQSRFSVDIGVLKLSLFCFLLGLAFAGVAIIVVYVIAQAASPWPNFDKQLSNFWHLSLMLVPSVISFAAFILGVSSLILNIESS